MSTQQRGATFEIGAHTLFISAENGTEYAIDVRVPLSYASGDRRYPVIYVLDSNLMFGTAIEYVGVAEFTGELPETIAVGIGYRDPSLASVIGQRRRDFTLAEDEDVYEKLRASAPQLPPSRGSGKAPVFSDHLRKLIVPEIESKYRVDPERRILFGDSLAGGFGAYLLLTHPEAFSGYVLGSPAIVQADGLLFTLEEQFAATHEDLRARVYMSVGSLEEPSMLSGVRELCDRLRQRKYPSLHLTERVFEGETHTSALSRNFMHGVRAMLCTKFGQGECAG